jgi:hypothetical protein
VTIGGADRLRIYDVVDGQCRPAEDLQASPHSGYKNGAARRNTRAADGIADTAVAWQLAQSRRMLYPAKL